jgi:hypothetical protein
LLQLPKLWYEFHNNTENPLNICLEASLVFASICMQKSTMDILLGLWPKSTLLLAATNHLVFGG